MVQHFCPPVLVFLVVAGTAARAEQLPDSVNHVAIHGKSKPIIKFEKGIQLQQHTVGVGNQKLVKWSKEAGDDDDTVDRKDKFPKTVDKKNAKVAMAQVYRKVCFLHNMG
jgi:hypothetical protein